jgi:patatin-like phospholipase/acyl hydrolase
LDGGGIRGIIEIGLLKAVCDKIGLGASVPIRSFFDLIIGTSTGMVFIRSNNSH